MRCQKTPFNKILFRAIKTKLINSRIVSHYPSAHWRNRKLHCCRKYNGSTFLTTTRLEVRRGRERGRAIQPRPFGITRGERRSPRGVEVSQLAIAPPSHRSSFPDTEETVYLERCCCLHHWHACRLRSAAFRLSGGRQRARPLLPAYLPAWPPNSGHRVEEKAGRFRCTPVARAGPPDSRCRPSWFWIGWLAGHCSVCCARADKQNIL